MRVELGRRPLRVYLSYCWRVGGVWGRLLVSFHPLALRNCLEHLRSSAIPSCACQRA